MDSKSPNAPQVLSYARPVPPSNLVTLRRLPPFESELARAKLEVEGIRCFIADRNMSAAHPVLFNEVQLQVLEEDLQQATEILDRSPEDGADGEYVDEDWRCPKCHKRLIELLPHSAGWRRARTAWLMILAGGVALFMLRGMLWGPSIESPIATTIDYCVVPWALSVIVLGMFLLAARRRKCCKECGHKWM